MRLLLVNGSPRAQSNTRILLDHFRRGLGEGHDVDEVSLRRDEDFSLERFCAADRVILAFPLYSDAMPSVVKRFIERLAPLCARPANPPIGFIVQSGFPEAFHSRPVERYLEKLAARLHSPYLGTVIKGGVEGIQVMPALATRTLYARFEALGRRFGESGRLDPVLVEALASPERLAWLGRLGFRVLGLLGLTRWYWDSQLKEHGAFERRFAQPYLPAAPVGKMRRGATPSAAAVWRPGATEAAAPLQGPVAAGLGGGIVLAHEPGPTAVRGH